MQIKYHCKLTAAFINLLVLTLLTISTPLYAETGQADHYDAPWYDGYSLTFGLSYQTVDLEVADADSLDTKGILSEGSEPGYFLTLYSPYRYFSTESSAGYYFEYGLSGFDMQHQKNNLEDTNTLDLGTSAKGYYFYLTPTVFYNFGDRFIQNNKGQNLKVGIGVGLGYLDAKGDIIFTNLSQERHEFDVSGIAFSYTVLIDYRYNNWIFRIRDNGPSLDKNNNSYTIYEESIDVGYVFTF